MQKDRYTNWLQNHEKQEKLNGEGFIHHFLQYKSQCHHVEAVNAKYERSN